MDGKKVLLIAPDWMGLHNDIIEGLKSLSYEVDYIPEKRYPYDPFYSLYKRRKSKSTEAFLSEIELYWKEILAKPEFSSAYDFLLVVDGQAIHPCLFEILSERNPHIKKVNYLFDRIEGVYAFDINFNYFDSIYTFDPSDSKKFNLNFMQIYWVPILSSCKKEYKIFGFGTYSKFRYNVFSQLEHIFSDVPGDKFIKVYNANVRNKYIHELINYIRFFLRMERNISLKELNSGLVVSDTIPTGQFREIIASSDVVVDTSAPYQDGITARFMWALGAEKRIITTNKSVRNYSFFSKEQIFVLDLDRINEQKNELLSFVEGTYVMPDSIRSLVNEYRIDNWIRTLLS